jgi:hypothetical protein
MNKTKIAIIGVGSVGAALGERLAEVGHEVVFGVRPGRDVEDLRSRCARRASAAPVPEACEQSEVIFLAVPAGAAVGAMANAPIGGKVVVDCNNPVAWDDGPVWSPPPEGSVTAQLAARYPEARWVKGFATFGSDFHRDPTIGDGGIDVHLAGDGTEAKDTVAAIARGAGFQPLDVGPLRNAAALENLAVLWIHLALKGGHGRQIAFQLQRRQAVRVGGRPSPRRTPVLGRGTCR